MESLAKSEIFFVISSFAVVIVTAGIIFAVYYFVKFWKEMTKFFEHAWKTLDGAKGSVHELFKFLMQSWLFKFVFGRKKK